jgi:predicted metal-dependent hydrolase
VIPGLQPALREYNAGRFFECHEALEELLDETAEEDWDFILGLIQVAVGYHKLTQHHAGGEKLLAMGLAKLAPYAADHGGLDLAALRRGVEGDLARLAEARWTGRIATPEPPRLLPISARR